MKRLFIILVLFSLSLVSLFSQEIKSIEVYTDKWEKCTNEDGTGLYFDILRTVFEPEGIKIVYKIVPYSKAVDSVTKGKADVALAVYEGEIENAIFPKWHFSADDIVACYIKGKLKEWEGERTLEGKKVSWMREYAYNEYLDVKMKISEIVDKRENGINLLLKDRLDFFLDNEMDLKATISDMKLDMNKFEIKLVKYLNLYIAFVNNERGKKLAEVWDKKFPEYLRTGKIKVLFKKWDGLMWYNF